MAAFGSWEYKGLRRLSLFDMQHQRKEKGYRGGVCCTYFSLCVLCILPCPALPCPTVMGSFFLNDWPT